MLQEEPPFTVLSIFPLDPTAQAPSVLWSYATTAGFLLLYTVLDLVMIFIIIRLFKVRWRVAQ